MGLRYRPRVLPPPVASRVARRALVACLALTACERTLDLGADADDAAAADAGPAGEGGASADAASVDPGDGGTSDGAAPDGSRPGDAGKGYVFVTRGTYPADLGGIAGADVRCQSSAAAAGLEGVYRAWISDSSVNAADRFTWPGPWLEVGTEAVLFPELASLRGFPLAPLVRDETGQVSPASRWWTGTAVNGIKHTKTCADWTSRDQSLGGMTGIRKFGDAGRPGKEWTEEAAFSCVFDNDLQRYALLCLRNG